MFRKPLLTWKSGISIYIIPKKAFDTTLFCTQNPRGKGWWGGGIGDEGRNFHRYIYYMFWIQLQSSCNVQIYCLLDTCSSFTLQCTRTSEFTLTNNPNQPKPQLKRRCIAQEFLAWTGLMLDKHWSVSCGLTGNWAECLVPLMSQLWTCKISWICKQLDVKRRVLRQWQCFSHCVGKANSYVPHCITKGKP